MPNPDLNPRFGPVHSRLRARADDLSGGALWEPGMVKRQYDQHVHAERVAFRPGLSVKSKQAWKYPGGKIQRAEDIYINGTKYIDPKEEPEEVPRRKQESNFLVTINTNRDYGEGAVATDALKAFNAALNALDNDPFIRYDILKFGPVDQKTFGGDNAVDVVHKLDWTSSVECGPNLGRMHSHSWLFCEHFSQVQINVPQLQHHFRTVFNDALPEGHVARLSKNVYVHVKLCHQSQWTDVLRGYVTKAMLAKDPCERC